MNVDPWLSVTAYNHRKLDIGGTFGLDLARALLIVYGND